MASEPRRSERHDALRRLLVDRADADGRRARSTAGRRSGAAAPGRLRVAVVTGVVLVAVVAGSAVVLDAVRPADSATAPTQAVPAPTRSAEPTTSAPAPTPDVSATTTAPLIAKRGAEVRTREELHAFVEADPILDGDAIWEEQAWLKIGCMADAGFLYDPVSEVDRGETGDEDDGLTAAEADAFEVALYGPPSTGPYDWRTAGCDGLAVHETGQDDAH